MCACVLGCLRACTYACVKVRVYVCVSACAHWGAVEGLQQAWGRIQRDEAFLIKRKYLCLHTTVLGTWDNLENSRCLMPPS